MAEEQQNSSETIELTPSQIVELLEKSTKQSSWSDSFIKNIQSILSLVVGLGALLTGSGFVIVNSYLAKFTDIFGYSITPGQYLTAGIGLWLIIGLFMAIGLFVIYPMLGYRIQRTRDTLKSLQNLQLSYQNKLRNRNANQKPTFTVDENNPLKMTLNLSSTYFDNLKKDTLKIRIALSGFFLCLLFFLVLLQGVGCMVVLFTKKYPDL